MHLCLVICIIVKKKKKNFSLWYRTTWWMLTLLLLLHVTFLFLHINLKPTIWLAIDNKIASNFSWNRALSCFKPSCSGHYKSCFGRLKLIFSPIHTGRLIAGKLIAATNRSVCTGLSALLWSRVVRPSVVNFSHFRLLLWNRKNRIQRNLTRSTISTSSTKFVFFGSIGTTIWLLGLWFAETLSTFPLKPLNGIQRNMTGSKILTSSTNSVFFGPIEKKRWPPGL